jgi:asparagine synthase (glutamine-hydrolysing)
LCGIAGIVGPFAEREAALRRMSACLAHRGPDGDGLHLDEHAGLAHRRLAVLDLTPAGAQPMRGARAVLTFNGEIYNHADLRAELERKGHVFRSRSDTEVVVRLWEEEGDGCFTRLRGMFALALWDPASRRLVLARDHFGQKPLFWARAGEALVFASEIKAIQPLVRSDIDPRGVDAFLSLGVVPSPLTCLASIHRLPPATLLSFTPGGEPATRPYFAPATGTRAISPEQAIEEVDAGLRSAVREQLRADVPVGLFLSGGIDSTLVLAAASEVAPITAFSVGFREPAYDELPHARAAARAFGARHETLVISADDARDPARLLDSYDEPFADVAALPLMALARAARPQVKVVLTGDGGDESFGGYPHHVAGAWMLRLGGGAAAGAALARAALGVTPRPVRRRSRLWTVRRVLEVMAAPGWRRGVAGLRANLAPEDRAALLEPAFAARAGDGYGVLEPERLVGPAGDPVLADRFLYKTDVATMAAGLESRSPFLDVRLAELGASLPIGHHVRRGQGKQLLRRLLARRPGIGPELTGRRKTGLGMPIEEWLRGPLAPLLREALLDGDARVRAYVRPRELRRRVAEHVAGAADHRRALWPLLILELWLRRVPGLSSTA